MTETTERKRLTKPAVMMHRDIARVHWHEPFSELLRYAQAGLDGFLFIDQPCDAEGRRMHYVTDDSVSPPQLRAVAPPDWAIFYGAEGDQTRLFFQNYSTTDGR